MAAHENQFLTETLTEEHGGRTSPSLGLYYDFKIGDHIAVTRARFYGKYEHQGVVVGFRTTDTGERKIIIVHWLRPNNSQFQSWKNKNGCGLCGYKGHSKDGGLALICIDCFSQGDPVFKIQHCGNQLIKPESNVDHLEPGQVLYRGYCNNKLYLGFFLDGKCQGYMRVKQKDHKTKCIDNRVRFVETTKRSIKEVMVAVETLAKESIVKSYDLLGNNCEHVVMLFMTGKRRSFQVENCHKMILKKIIWKILYCYRGDNQAAAITSAEIEPTLPRSPEKIPLDGGNEDYHDEEIMTDKILGQIEYHLSLKIANCDKP